MEGAVRKVDDQFVEVPTTYSETGHAASPIKLRSGTDDGQVTIDGIQQASIADFREALDLIEREQS